MNTMAESCGVYNFWYWVMAIYLSLLCSCCAESAQAAGDVERFAGDPPGIRRGQKNNGGSDVLRLGDAPQRRDRGEGFEFADQPRCVRALGFDGTRIDRVDPDFARPQFLGKGAGQPIH